MLNQPHKTYLIWLAVFLFLTACFPEAATSTIAAGQTSPAETTTTPSFEIAAATGTLPSPSATPTLPATVTRIETAAPTRENCVFTFFFEPAPGSCPSGEAVYSAAAEQPFEGGTMIWLEELDSIIVLQSDGNWRRFEDTWSEEQTELDPSLIPPAGLYQPVRGFGKVWREQAGVGDLLGWGKSQELGFETLFQAGEVEEDGLRILYLRLFNSQVAALSERSENQGDWVLATSP